MQVFNHQYFWQTMFSEINFSFKYSGFNKIGRFKYTLKQKLHTNSWMKYELLKKTNLQRIIQICNMDNSFSILTILSFWILECVFGHILLSKIDHSMSGSLFTFYSSNIWIESRLNVFFRSINIIFSSFCCRVYYLWM